MLDNYTDSTWRSNVSRWLNNSLHESKEALGLDGLRKTGDAGEGDGKWTVDYYIQQDYDKGLMPPGKSIGDVIPGSGEDIDGDGVCDSRISLTNFDMAAALNSTNWGGNLPAGASSISDLDNPAGPRRVKEIHALLYTNHALAGLFGCSAPWSSSSAAGSPASNRQSPTPATRSSPTTNASRAAASPTASSCRAPSQT